MSWINYNNSVDIYIPDYSISSPVKLYIFDLDNTLIVRSNPKNSVYFDEDIDNWIFIDDVASILNDLYNEGYTIVILTNQFWKGKDRSIIFNRIESVREELNNKNGWSPYIIISYEKDKYRKPEIGSIDIICTLLKISNIEYKQIKELKGDKEKTELKKIKICGDAIGNENMKENVNPRFSWGTADYDYYLNVKNIFSNTYFVRPDKLVKSNREEVKEKIENKDYDVVILMGNQGSGKSTFASLLSNYVHIQKDKLKTETKMIKEIRKQLNEGNRVVVDATNSSEKNRKIWIDLAEDLNKSCCIVWFIFDGRPFNELRKEKKVPAIAYNIYTKNFEFPTKDEGCRIYRVH